MSLLSSLLGTANELTITEQINTINNGASGTAGAFNQFPATAAKGKTVIATANNTGNTTTTIQVAAQAGAVTYTIPDAGASASFVMTEVAQTINGVKTFGSAPVSANGIALVSGHVEMAYQDTTITSAQLLALNATPQTVVTAPGASKAIIPLGMVLYHAGGTAYAGIAAGEDLVLKYTNGSGAQCSPQVETTGFLDQTTAQTRYVGPYASAAAVADITPVANAAVVLHLLTGEIITGDFNVKVRVFYKVIPTVL